MIEAYCLHTGRTTLDLREVVEYSQGLYKHHGKVYSCTNVITRYAAKHVLLISYNEFQEVLEKVTGKIAIKTF